MVAAVTTMEVQAIRSTVFYDSHHAVNGLYTIHLRFIVDDPPEVA